VLRTLLEAEIAARDASNAAIRLKVAAFSVINTLDVARLGLRSIEAARLRLGDIDWRSGGIILRGKATREDGTSLLAHVGQALAWQKKPRPAIPLGFFARVVAAADVKTTSFRRRARTDAQADSCAS
jgi:integrase